MTTIAAARTPARQLDIIADTALASDPRLAPKVQCFVKRDPKPQKYSASSSVTAIDKRRKAAGMSHERFCRAGGVTVRNWFRLLRGEQQPSAKTLEKLEAAMAEPRSTRPPQIVAGFHRQVMQLLAIRMAFDVDTLLATDFSVQRPSNPQWLRAARIRQMAIYIMTVEMQVSNADLGRALGDTRANIKFARDAIEDRREDGNEIDLALSAVTLQVKAGD